MIINVGLEIDEWDLATVQAYHLHNPDDTMQEVIQTVFNWGLEEFL